MKVLFYLVLAFSFIGCAGMDYGGKVRILEKGKVKAAGGFQRIVQEFQRTNPDYIYTAEIESSAVPIIGGYNVLVVGYKKSTEQIESNQVQVREWFFSKPDWETLNRMVDNVHGQIRGGQTERDWDKDNQAERDKLREELKEKMRREFENDLDRKLKEIDEKLKDNYDKNKPKF